MDGRLGFWLGLGLSIPLSILANFLTVPMQRYLRKRSQTAKAADEVRMKREEDAAQRMIDDSSAFTSHLLFVLLNLTRTAIVVILIVVLSTILTFLAVPGLPLVFALTVYAVFQVTSSLNLIRRTYRIAHIVFREKDWPSVLDLLPVDRDE